MFAKDYRRAAWQKLSGNWTTAVVAYLIYALLLSAVSFTGIGTLILTGPLTVGFVIIMLDINRRGASTFETLFDGFRRGLGNNIVAGILVPLFTALWSLLFIVPGIIKTYSYSMTYFILADNPDMTATEAITESRKMMDGNKWRLFCLNFSFIGWALLTVLTFGILAFWVSPYMEQARAEFYESIKPASASNDDFTGGMADETVGGTTQL